MKYNESLAVDSSPNKIKRMQTKTGQKLKTLRIGSIIITLVGVALLGYMIKVEDEPGALPLLLTLTGILSFIFIQKKIKSTSR